MAKKVETLGELKWIDEEPKQILARPPLELKPIGQRTFMNTFWKKTRENALVPIGLIATTVCLTLGLFNMRKGNTQKQQMYMQGRVGFQAFTLVAMTVGMYYTAREKNKNPQSRLEETAAK